VGNVVQDIKDARQAEDGASNTVAERVASLCAAPESTLFDKAWELTKNMLGIEFGTGEVDPQTFGALFRVAVDEMAG
jgi:hypothetical protein